MTDHEATQSEGRMGDDRLIEHVRELIGMMAHGGITELDVTSGDMSVRLRSAATAPQVVIPPGAVPGVPQIVSVPVTAVEESAPKGHVVTSPMIGTFYAAPAPGEPQFVAVGDEVEVGQVIGIIEAMKIMNEITADKHGVVVEVMVQNAQPVEYGSPLMRIVPPGLVE